MKFHGNRLIHSGPRAAIVFTLILLGACSDNSSGGTVATGAEPQGTQAASGSSAKPAATAGASATSSSSTATAAAGRNSPAGAAAPGVASSSSTAGAPSSPASAGAAAPSAGTTGSTPSGATSAAGAAAAAPGAAGAAGASGGPSAAGSGATAPANAAGKLPHVTMVEGMGLEDAVKGPWGPAVKEKNIPPGGWLVYPQDIGKDGTKHPIFIFGPGGGTNPPYYDMNGMHWDHYSSYGFVIYIAAMSSFESAQALDDGLTWVIAQNDEPSSPLYQKLDTTRVGAAGHSQGSVMVFNFMPDDRVTTTIHISGGSSGGSGPKNLKSDTMFLCGPSSDVAYAQCETDFEATTVPTFYTNILESSHITSGRYGWGAIVAWLLWHLADHEEWKKEFLEPDGQFQTGRYTSKTKNFK